MIYTFKPVYKGHSREPVYKGHSREPVYKGHSREPVYKGHSREPENVAFISSFSLYTGSNYMHYSFMGKMRQSFIDSDLLYRGAL